MKKQTDSPFKNAILECRPLLLGAFLFGLFINLLMLAVPLYSLQVLDRVLSSGSLDTLLVLTVIVAVAIVFMGILQILRSLIFSHLGRWLDDRLSSDIVENTVTIAIHDPKIGSQPLRDLNAVRSFVTSPHLAGLFDAPWAIIFFIVIYIINVQLGLVVTGGAVILLVLAFISERAPAKMAAAAHDEQIKSMQSLDAIVRNAEVVKSMGLLNRARARWHMHNQHWLGHAFNSSNISNVISQSTRSLRLSIQMGTMCIGAFLALSNQMSPGSIIAVSILTARALAPFDAAAPLYQALVGVKKALTRLFELERFGEKRIQTTKLPDPEGKVSIQKVSFVVGKEKRPILKAVSCEVAPGEAIGIIGPSGSGKTTLARMIVGVTSPSVGDIRLDGATLHQWDSDQLGTAIGYLPQSVELFDGTIAENIARLDSNAADEAVVKAAQSAHVHESILAFSNGYQTDIGPNGSRLSAGQRQRVALARCFYGDPKLIVMDEPNANLDGEGELAFVKALERAKNLGITTVTIAHRPSVLQRVDKLLVLHDGQVKMFGPTQEILAELSANNSKIQPIRAQPVSATK